MISFAMFWNSLEDSISVQFFSTFNRFLDKLSIFCSNKIQIPTVVTDFSWARKFPGVTSIAKSKLTQVKDTNNLIVYRFLWIFLPTSVKIEPEHRVNIVTVKNIHFRLKKRDGHTMKTIMTIIIIIIIIIAIILMMIMTMSLF